MTSCGGRQWGARRREKPEGRAGGHRRNKRCGVRVLKDEAWAISRPASSGLEIQRVVVPVDLELEGCGDTRGLLVYALARLKS